MDDNFLAILNVTVGAICLVTLLFALWLLLWRIHRAMLSGRTWTRPRRFLVNLALWELGLQVVNLTFFLAPNATWLADPCTPFRGVVHGAVFVQFSCWLGLFTIFVISVQGFMPITPGTNSVRGLPLYSWWLRRNGETVPADATSVLDLPTWVHADLVRGSGGALDGWRWGRDCSRPSDMQGRDDVNLLLLAQRFLLRGRTGGLEGCALQTASEELPWQVLARVCWVDQQQESRRWLLLP